MDTPIRDFSGQHEFAFELPSLRFGFKVFISFF